jgi:hypothetical protein
MSVMRPALAAAALMCASAAPAPKIIPERLLQCTLKRMTNFDPSANQSAADITYEGRYPFALRLPERPVRTAPPPDITEAPEPVDPRTRVVADPAGLTKDFPNQFNRVVDLWPERVEMTSVIDQPLVNMIIINPIDPAKGTATLFMTRAKDLNAYDSEHMYTGDCRIETTKG